MSDWLLTDKVSSWTGTHASRSWRYLRLCLERHDGAETDYRYTKVTLETILAFDRSNLPPPWLIQSLAVRSSRLLRVYDWLTYVTQEHHPEYLIRTSLRYDVIEQALEHTMSLLRKVRLRCNL